MTGPTDRPAADIRELLSHVADGQQKGHVHVSLFGLRNYEAANVVEHIQRGLSYAAYERFRRNVDLPERVVARVAEVPERTLARRKQTGRFEPDESDRLIRLGRIVARALELFEGDAAVAQRWLLAPLTALGGRAPIEFAATDVGAIEVDRVIGRLSHGIPT